MRPLLLAILLLIATPVAAQQTRSLAPGAASPSATIDRLGWLAGRWHGEGLGGTVTEVYSPPAAGQMSGHFEMIADGKLLFYEIMQIVERDGSLAYRLKHFNADLSGWEEKDEAVEFRLVAIEGDAFHFDGMSFYRTAPDAMTVWVRIGDEADGSREERFDYRRAGD